MSLKFAALALVLCAVSGSNLKLAGQNGATAIIDWDGTTLTVPQHCREDTCTDHGNRVAATEASVTAFEAALQAVNLAQVAENTALRTLIAGLRADLMGLAKTHHDDIAVSTNADTAFTAADTVDSKRFLLLPPRPNGRRRGVLTFCAFHW